MHEPLATLLHDGVIEEICGRLKSGKEADLWMVRHGGELVAAKVYKARHARSFKNNAGYKEGRQVRDTRTQRAMDRGSRFGQAAAEEAWKTKESDALHALHAAGVRVPNPVLFYEGVLLMELVVDADGRPAPLLLDAHVAQDAAAALYADLRAQVVRMLTCDLIHGDLSPYNVLVGRDGPVVIDFPQVVGAAHNSQAESFFRRDLENLRRFFAAIDPALGSAAGDAAEIWRAYVRRELTPDFVPTGKGVPPAREARRQHGGGPRAHEPRGEPRTHEPRTHEPRSHQPRAHEPRTHGPPHGHGRGPAHGPARGQTSPATHSSHAPPHGRPEARSAHASQPRPPRHPAAPGQHARGRAQETRAPGRERGGHDRGTHDRGTQDRSPHGRGAHPAAHDRPAHVAGGGRPPAQRPQNRRRETPAPEVIRVTRPPLSPSGHGPAAPPHGHPRANPPAAPRREGGGQRPRRRGPRGS
jgi:RIO kinase 1